MALKILFGILIGVIGLWFLYIIGAGIIQTVCKCLI
tara:strand:+ start:143 stop:250 length:108 start_codon:yes stop_codon:yes gene_type:complete